MRLFVANWKMHKTREEARAFAAELSRAIGEGPPPAELVVAPPLTALDAAGDPKGRWRLAAQDVAAEPSGAFTGEVSAAMLADAGCRYVLVGHSERRRLFREDGPLLARKLARAREAGLTPIYCLGETEEERSGGRTEAVLEAQAATLAGDPASAPLVVAYEPVWAIGTGKTPTTPEVAAAHAHIRKVLGGLTGEAQGVRLLYGGSVKGSNAAELLAAGDVDGALIGGASLKADEFLAIAKAA